MVAQPVSHWTTDLQLTGLIVAISQYAATVGKLFTYMPVFTSSTRLTSAANSLPQKPEISTSPCGLRNMDVHIYVYLFLICKQILQKRIKCFATDVWCLKEKLAFKKFLLGQHYPT